MAKYNVSMGMIAADGSYAIPDVPDGEFLLQILRMPADLSKAAQMRPEDLMPLFQEKVKIQNGLDLEKNIVLPADGGQT